MTWKYSLNILETLETFMKNRFEILFHQKQELKRTVFGISCMDTCEHKLKLLWDFVGNIIENKRPFVELNWKTIAGMLSHFPRSHEW
jgi:hypothetical protein